MTGWCGRDEALDHLAQATVYVHWTAWDGQPLSVLEALARDVIVIASDIPANRDIVGAGQVFDSVGAAQAFLRRVLADPGPAGRPRGRAARPPAGLRRRRDGGRLARALPRPRGRHAQAIDGCGGSCGVAKRPPSMSSMR